MSEPREHQIKRLKMRAVRRGIREMDLILSTYADRHLATMDDAGLALFEALLHENDQDLYQWVTGQATAPDRFKALIGDIALTFQT